MLNDSFKKHFFILREKGREGEREKEREREREIDVRHTQTLIGCLSHVPPKTQACALTQNLTGDHVLFKVMPNQLSHTSLGINNSLNNFSTNIEEVMSSIKKEQKVINQEQRKWKDSRIKHKDHKREIKVVR